MTWDEIDWGALTRLRAGFLAGATNYWRSERDLGSYDLTFAQRIGWKWDYVLGELKRLGWQPAAGDVLDWGCGSGIAGRAFLGEFGAESLTVLDRSELAVRYAEQRAREKFPTIPVRTRRSASLQTLLMSHVITELDEQGLTEVLALAREATTVIWVEPGTFAASRQLIAAREQLPGHIVAPCPHRGSCGMLAAENARHWCHFFAPVPRGIFQDGNWMRFSKMAGVDLRSLPVSYLVLDKRALPAATKREIGRARVYKAHALVLDCDAGGVREREVRQREQPEEFRRLQK